ncbi:peptidyl-prolyl cis-trans isomerase [Microbulbifer bruguierae]|uniref:peptidylprolyl isomerase n=1 Tax=Microbulbifer bruguierae TaxID=3029061 RepID=A0ABY8NGK7_9GAMM|nr:peptidyl-prolyl cis-trans isomerase [Microbulbifer bruguierae]WGL18075.1 peptidyl-prolyl cis-trans isomerase [Microbulbifer bruguierae]
MASHWTRDPCLHFAVIGAMLFVINSLFADPGQSDRSDLVISESRIRHLAAIYERGWQRPPNRDELQALVEDFVREEVLYREAMRLGLDKDDTVIRRRLRMKMEYLAKDLIDAIEPSNQVLQAYYQQHLDKYIQPAQYSFEQVFLDSDKRVEVAEDARILLTKLTAGSDPEKLGDGSLLQHRFEHISSERIDRTFGNGFAQQLRELHSDQWSGPLTSAFGEHLVRITAYRPERQPDFGGIRTDVLRDWQEEEQKKILQTQYDTLRANYWIEIAETPMEMVRQ